MELKYFDFLRLASGNPAIPENRKQHPEMNNGFNQSRTSRVNRFVVDTWNLRWYGSPVPRSYHRGQLFCDWKSEGKQACRHLNCKYCPWAIATFLVGWWLNSIESSTFCKRLKDLFVLPDGECALEDWRIQDWLIICCRLFRQLLGDWRCSAWCDWHQGEEEVDIQWIRARCKGPGNHKESCCIRKIFFVFFFRLRKGRDG